MADLEWLKSESRYSYLSREDSELYAKVKDSPDPKDQQIKKLLEDKAAACYGSHCLSKY